MDLVMDAEGTMSTGGKFGVEPRVNPEPVEVSGLLYRGGRVKEIGTGGGFLWRGSAWFGARAGAPLVAGWASTRSEEVALTAGEARGMRALK